MQHVKNPSEFWVQTDLAMERHEAMQLKMSEIYYCGGGDDFTIQSPKVGTLCAALIKPDGFYRVTVRAVHGRKVKVCFVDHGSEAIVDQQDLWILSSELKKMPALAFKCSLSGISPTDQEWGQMAINFFEDEAKQILLDMHVSAQCEDAYLVELFCKTAGLRSINEMMCLEGLAVKDLSDDRYSPRPDSGCSTAEGSGEEWTERDIMRSNYTCDIASKGPLPDMVVGSLEQVWITCVKDVHKFYGQLVRHVEEIEKVNERIMHFCRQPKGTKCSLVPGAPCFAQYSDGQWYRGRVKMTHPIVLVHFLDYGDIVAVKRSDLLPVPNEANEIMSFPVQAIEFNLSDVPVDTSNDVNRWFDKNATGQHFTAKVLEKYPGGKYTVELYDGKLNVNKAVKKKALGTGWGAPKVLDYPLLHQTSTSPTVRESKMSVMGNYVRKQENPSFLHRSKNEIHAHISVCTSLNNSDIPPIPQNSEKITYKPKEVFSATEPSSLPMRRTNGDTAKGVKDVSYKAFHNPPKTEKTEKHVKGTHCPSEPSSVSLPKLDCLPERQVIPDVETEVYVSHVNSHSSFFVQLVEDEIKIHSLVEKLNSDENQPCNMSDVDVKNLQVGEIVVAMFPDDCSWYRAVIKKVNDCDSILIEFIDFGNEATVISNMVRSLNSFMDTPRLSVHCCLNANGIPGISSAEEGTSKLKDMAEGEVKKMICIFVKQLGSVWEVCFVDPESTLKTSQTNLANSPHIDKYNVSETKQAAFTPDVPCPSECGRQHIQVKLTDLPSRPIKPGIVTEVYISHVNSQDSFFVQLVEDEDQIFALVEELNADQPSSPSTDLKTLQEGDLISALYAEDEAWYRAVVKKINDDDSILVEFIDFGNEASVEANMVDGLKNKFLDTPRLSVHCFLGYDVHGPFNSTFKEETAFILKDYAKGEAKKMSCVFIKEFGNVWEMRLINLNATEPNQKSEDSAMKVL